MLSHVRRERFLVITLPAMENKRSGAAEVAGIGSTRLAKTPNQGKRYTTPRRHSIPRLPGDSRTSFAVIEGLRALVDVGGDRPQDAHEISKLRVLSEDDKEFVQAMCQTATHLDTTGS